MIKPENNSVTTPLIPERPFSANLSFFGHAQNACFFHSLAQSTVTDSVSSHGILHLNRKHTHLIGETQ